MNADNWRKTLKELGDDKDDGSRHSMTVYVDPALLADERNSDLPPRYTVENITKRLPGVLNTFTRIEDPDDGDDDDDAISTRGEHRTVIHGTVTRSCHFQISREPLDDASSVRNNTTTNNNNSSNNFNRSLCRKRLIENNARSREVLPVGPSEVCGSRARAVLADGKRFGKSVRRHSERLIEAKEAAIATGRKKKLAGAGIGERTSARSVIFSLFSYQTFWTSTIKKTKVR